MIRDVLMVRPFFIQGGHMAHNLVRRVVYRKTGRGAKVPWPVTIYGASDRNRTRNQLITNQLLYH